MRQKILVFGAIGVLLAVLLWLFIGRKSDGSNEPVANNYGKPAIGKSSHKKSVVNKGEDLKPNVGKHIERPQSAGEDDDGLSEKIEAAVEEEDVKKFLSLLEKARNSSNAEVRLDAVEGLVWFGADYLSELMGFVGDPDEQVREAALDGCDLFIGEIEDEKLRADTIQKFAAHLWDRTILKTMLAKLESVKESIALDALYEIIRDGSPAAREAAKEEYSHITGSPFTSFKQIRQHQGDVVQEEKAEEAAAAEDTDI